MFVGCVRSMVYTSPLVKLPLRVPTPPSGLPARSRIESLSITSNRSVPSPAPVFTVTV